MLIEKGRAVRGAIESRYGKGSKNARYWLDNGLGAHLHVLSPPVLALSSATWDTVASDCRGPFGEIVGEVLGGPVEVVYCNALGGAQ